MAHLTSTKRGYAQKEGIDYEETFSPKAKWATIRTLLSLAAQNGWKVHQMDVKTAFLNGDLKENVFMSQPEGFVVKGKEQKVCVARVFTLACADEHLLRNLESLVAVRLN